MYCVLWVFHNNVTTALTGMVSRSRTQCSHHERRLGLGTIHVLQ